MPNLVVTVQGVVITDAGHTAGRLLWQCDVVERETIEMLRFDEGKAVEHWGAESWRRPQREAPG
jgi:predicted SnoaL-like aldol condensation-catalyzing enzyme